MQKSFKQLRFPVSGVAKHLAFRDSTIPDERNAFASPDAVNVRGSCTYGGRVRGGSRPGLRRIEGAVSVENGGKWLWPNGEAIEWPDGGVIVYTTVTQELTAPDGSVIIDPHEAVSARCSKGAVPPVPSLAAVYRNRVFLASGADWFCSRIGEHGDFDYGGDAEDIARALSGNCALAGRKGERITAFMPVDDNVMYVATARSLWVFDGDPSSGLKRISEYVGCVSANAWCATPYGVCFVGADGVYLASGDGVKIVSEKLPDDFAGLSDALLAYDPRERGVHVFGTKDGEVSDWFFDVEKTAFWPVRLPGGMRPVSMCRILDDGVDRIALLGADGTWRMFHDEQSDDDGTVMASELVIGPFRVSARDDLDGILDEIHAAFGSHGADVAMEVYCGESGEDAVSSAMSREMENVPSFVFSGGRNKVVRARTRGAWACLKISSLGRWAYEGVEVGLKLLGRLR